MNCRQFETIINDLARGKLLEAGLRERGLAHAADCERCGARLSDERTLTVGLKTFAANSENAAAPPQLETALLAAFRQTQHPTASNVVALPLKRRHPKVWVFAAAAAAILIAALTFAASKLMNEPTSTQPDVSQSPNSATGTAPKDDLVAAEIVDPTEKKPPVKPRKKRSPRQSQGRSQVLASVGEFTPIPAEQDFGQEIATDFFPLLHDQASQPLESGQLIRVQMPRSTLASFGLPVNFERANVPVKADVLLAEDGSAHAIRFIR